MADETRNLSIEVTNKVRNVVASLIKQYHEEQNFELTDELLKQRTQELLCVIQQGVGEISLESVQKKTTKFDSISEMISSDHY